MGTSVVIAAYNRPHLLEKTLPVIMSQLSGQDEALVINDYLPDRTEQICQENGAKYFFIGHRNLEKITWRTPCVTHNFGVKQAQCGVIILTCAEMLCLNDSIGLITAPVLQDNLAIGIPTRYHDMDNLYTQSYFKTNDTRKYLDTLPILPGKLPFFIALRKEHYMEIGGYDEDFATGSSFDDDDLVDRLILNGCHYVQTGADVVHLWHETPPTKNDPGKYEYSVKIYNERKGVIKRNVGKEWGQQ